MVEQTFASVAVRTIGHGTVTLDSRDERMKRGIHSYQRGHYHEAIAEFTAALELGGPYLPAFFQRGVAFMKLGGPTDLRAARDNFAAALNLDPRDTRSRSNLAGVLCDLGLPLDAQIEYQQLIRMEPENADHYYNFSLLLFENPAFSSLALQLLDRAIELDPIYDRAYLNRAIGYYNLGDTSEATHALYHLLYTQPQFLDHPTESARALIHGLWGSTADEMLDEVRQAPRPLAGFPDDFPIQNEVFAALRRMLTKSCNAANVGIRTNSVLAARVPRVFFIVANDEPGEGLAGCFMDQRENGTHLIVVPVSLVGFLFIFTVLLLADRPAARNYAPDLDRCKRYYRRYNHSTTTAEDSQFSPELQLPQLDTLWNIGSPSSVEQFVKDLSQVDKGDLFNALISPLSQASDRLDALKTLALAVPHEFATGDLSVSDISLLPVLVLKFAMLHELGHVAGLHMLTLDLCKNVIPEQSSLWCAEFLADCEALKNMLAQATQGQGDESGLRSIVFAIGILMVLVQIQQQLIEDESEAPRYPPVSLRMHSLRQLCAAAPHVLKKWDSTAMELMERMHALGQLLGWKELCNAAETVFTEEIRIEDLEYKVEHMGAFVQLANTAGARGFLAS